MRFPLAVAAIPALAASVQAQISYEFTPGPGLIALAGTDPGKAMSIMDGVEAAAAKWSGRIGEAVTLKYTVDYDESLPALGAAADVYLPAPYVAVKGALAAKASSAFDAVATGSLQPGASLKLWVNDLFDPPSLPPYLDTDGSVNNTIMDVSRAHMKGLGLLAPGDGMAGADGTLIFGSADFDFDPSDGIDDDHYDFVGVALHELVHSLGFVSGVDTLSTLLPTPFSPPGPIHATPMVTVLDLFRYSSDSLAAGPLVPDVSLPVPGFAPDRYFSIDGGLTPMELFSTGVGLAGDGHQAGHWKMDAIFGLMDPTLADGFELTDAVAGYFSGPVVAPDLIALDVIGWTIVPAPSSAGLLLLASGGLIVRRRRR